MPYVTSIERLAREEGRAEGLQEAIVLALQAMFGPRARKLLPKVRALQDSKALRALARTVVSAESLEAVQQHLPGEEQA